MQHNNWFLVHYWWRMWRNIIEQFINTDNVVPFANFCFVRKLCSALYWSLPYQWSCKNNFIHWMPNLSCFSFNFNWKKKWWSVGSVVYQVIFRFGYTSAPPSSNHNLGTMISLLRPQFPVQGCTGLAGRRGHQKINSSARVRSSYCPASP